MKIRNCFCKYAIEDNQVAYIPNWPKSLSSALYLCKKQTYILYCFQVFLTEYAGPLFIYLIFYARPAIIYGAAAGERRASVVK